MTRVMCSWTGREKGRTATILAFVLGSVSCAGAGGKSQNGGSSPTSEHASQTAADVSKRDQGPSDEAVTNAVVEARLRQTITELPPNSGVQRIALADVAYPASADENRRLAGFTLLVATAVTHDPAELPPRVFVRTSGGELELPVLLSRIGSLDPPDLRAVFGPHRFDGLYAIPIQATQIEAKVLANFKGPRRDFQLLAFPGSALPPGVEPLPPGEPDMNAIQSFAEREFPIVEERDLVSR